MKEAEEVESDLGRGCRKPALNSPAQGLFSWAFLTVLRAHTVGLVMILFARESGILSMKEDVCSPNLP